MRFDVIVGNPPYQQRDGGAFSSSVPIYQYFVLQAKKLSPHYIVMIIPSRWFSSGKGLDDFRREMLRDRQIRKIVNFESSRTVFEHVDIAGGICYFLWERNSSGRCEVVRVNGSSKSASLRMLDGHKVFIRDAEALKIIEKIRSKRERTMDLQVSTRAYFGLRTDVRPLSEGDIIIYWRDGIGLYKRELIKTRFWLIDKWKVIVPGHTSEHSGWPLPNGKRKLISKIIIAPPGSVCTETFLVAGSFDTKEEADNLASYIKTKFFRFLLSQAANSQHIARLAYMFVPVQDMHEKWTDEKLYTKYNLSKDEIEFIESKIENIEK